ncbi:hypothetical protein HGRIS_004361 [Hohenbuehelia grisea]|uniref:Uncharacterized protein n=1 Tax=Hohenbuehelia grisea TaxID=104357 RepID=A0ABR3JBK8_9AGAR
MTCRERRCWTEQEDELLRDAVRKEDPDTHPPSKWHQIAKHVPNRTNKDCRKRWFAKFAAVVAKGGWSADEDERLIRAVETYGTKWSLVASEVVTRNNDQCAKRWSDTLNPSIDRTSWSPEEDAQLLQAVQVIGKSWTKIVKTYFPGRTGLSAKNRYCRLLRIMSDSSRGSRPRRRSATIGAQPYKGRRRSATGASVSSDSSSARRPSPDSPYSLFFPEYPDISNTTGLSSSSPSLGIQGFPSGADVTSQGWPADFLLPAFSGKQGLPGHILNTQISMDDLASLPQDLQASSSQRALFERMPSNPSFPPSSSQAARRLQSIPNQARVYGAGADPTGLVAGTWPAQARQSQLNSCASHSASSSFDMGILSASLAPPIQAGCRAQPAISSSPQSQPHSLFHMASPSRSSVTSASASPPMQKPYDLFPSQHSLAGSDFDMPSTYNASAGFSGSAGPYDGQTNTFGMPVPPAGCGGYDAASAAAYQWFVGKFEDNHA